MILLLTKRRPAAGGTSGAYPAQTPGMAGDFFESPRGTDANLAAGTPYQAPSSPSRTSVSRSLRRLRFLLPLQP